jgi:broad specificity phosphatase PhoE
MMTAYLLLIRHALPQIQEAIPAREWPLSDEGRARCLALSHRIQSYAPVKIYGSRERKASETGRLVAERLSVPFEETENLHEHERAQEPFYPREVFEHKIKEFFTNPNELRYGKETAAQARGRFVQAVAHLARSHVDETIAVISHGTVISLFVQLMSGADPFPLWQRLGMPSFVVIDSADNAVIEIVSEVV